MIFYNRSFHLSLPALALTLAAGLSTQGYSQQIAPAISSVSGGVGGTTNTNIAPGEIITIFGTNLATTDGNLSSFTGTALPMTLGGVQVSIAGKQAPLFMVSTMEIIAQVPFEAPVGQQGLTVTSGTAIGSTFNAMVTATAPTWFSDASGAVIVRATDYSLIGAANPAQPGDTLLIYATGLGQTKPAIATGMLAGTSSLANTAPVTVTIGGQNATVLYSVASPGYAGLSQIAVQAPPGVAGTVPVAFSSGNTTSNSASIITGLLRGTAIDPQIQAVNAQLQALGPVPIQNLTPAEARLQPSFADAGEALLQGQGKSTTPQAVASVQNTTVPGGAGPVPARIYTPAGAGPFPVIVFFHGGGFVIATIDTYDASARELSNAASAIVVSVEYRKAPENKFPAATQDAYAAVQWVMNNAASLNGRADRVVVDGESAGGNLATVVCMMARDLGGKMPAYQVLVYPVTNLASESPSYEENGNAPFLTRAALRWFGSYYLNSKTDALNPYASPVIGDAYGTSARDGDHGRLRSASR